MSYISRVKNTANQHFDLHDSRLGEGEELNVVKDWQNNDTQSSEYIKNRTHYIKNRFELVDLDWSGDFTSEQAPKNETLNTKILYRLSKIPLTSEEITTAFVDKMVVYYKPLVGDIDSGILSEVISGTLALQTNFIDDPDNKVKEIIYGIENSSDVDEYFVLYNVADTQEVIIDSTTITLEPGVYGLGFNIIDQGSHGIYVIRYYNETEYSPLNENYIPDTIARIADLDNYATITYVNNAIQTISGQIPDISGKMDKNNPEGTGRLKIKGNDGYALFAKDAYVNYDFDLGQGQKVATENYVTIALTDKMDANKRIFDSLFIGDSQNNNRVLTTADISTISGKTFKGIYANSSYLPVGAGRVEEGDYAYVLNGYTTGGLATITKHTYTNGSWVAAQDSLATNTFTPTQWKNINTDISPYVAKIEELEGEVADFYDIIETMFEFAEGKEF